MGVITDQQLTANMKTDKPSTPSDQRCQRLPRSFTRRQVLSVCSGCALAGAATVTRALAAWDDPIAIGKLEDYSADEISEKYIRHNFFVTRHEGRLFATVATCPHKGNYLFRNAEKPKEIICSGHDAVYDSEGKPVSSPVRHALERFGIAVDDEGIVRVDIRKRFPEAKWDDGESFILLKAKKS
jgi:nitrite reductase/ring-hydroxylating ferredoxin subunit